MHSHQVKINGNFELPVPLKKDYDYEFTIQATCWGINDDSNNEGGSDFTYKIKPISGEVKNELGQILKLIDKKRQSQKLRGQIVALTPGGKDTEEFYEATMVKIRHYLPEILDYIEKLN